MSVFAHEPESDSQHDEWKARWERIHAAKAPGETSWYQAHPEYSLSLIEDAGLGTRARIIDIGGGTSTLADHLITAGYHNITVLDIALLAIERARERLGENASRVNWLVGDVAEFQASQRFDIWHDRAVFHFMTRAQDRARYLDTLKQTLTDNGHAIIATFSESGPDRCSGLEVVRYSPASLANTIGPEFHLAETLTEMHRTPEGGEQEFIYCRFCRNCSL